MRIFVSVPRVESSCYSSGKVSHKAHSGAKSDNQIYDNKENCSLEIVVLFVFVEIICVDREERHRESTSSNSWTFWEEVEKYTNKNCRPNPESPCPLFTVSVFYHAADKEEEYDITDEMPESTMEEAIEYELS